MSGGHDPSSVDAGAARPPGWSSQPLPRSPARAVKALLRSVFRDPRTNEKLLLFFAAQVRETLTARLLRAHGRILGGLFEGLAIPAHVSHRNLAFAQVMGSYESFLQAVIAEVAPRHDRFVDIGCACGFYTNGVAKRFGLPAVGVELDAEQVPLADAIAAANGLTDVRHVHERPGYDLLTYLQDGALHLVDIEGGEWELVERVRPETLRRAGFLVELHEAGGRSIADLQAAFEARFGATHEVRWVREAFPEDEVLGRLQALGVPRTVGLMALAESRGIYQIWADIRPR
ncbi:MAG: class I SAM-dependent methyltransferase [Alphaproteobacteria bacterium]|nr:class I SAM-dependent methyltransferase [Alphaproteobacteria bacterium]